MNVTKGVHSPAGFNQPTTDPRALVVDDRFQTPKTDSSGSINGFSPLKPVSPNPTVNLPKSGKFWSKSFKSNDIYAKFREISSKSDGKLIKPSTYLTRLAGSLL